MLKIHLGLHRISAILARFGNPQNKFAVLHIAGTNGKGSVAAMSESILRHAGWKTGLYTSPHLVRLEERIRVNGRAIAQNRLASLVRRIERVERRMAETGRLDRPLSYFEMMTAAAFMHFSEQAVDIAVVEVGLGGRLDATNVVQPQAVIITGISYDHQEILGGTLAEIAAEKAGIMKPGVPTVSGCRASEARRVIRSRALSLPAPLLEIDRVCGTKLIRKRAGRFTIDVQTPVRHYKNIHLALAGEHQARNAAMAIAGVESLTGFPTGIFDVQQGLRHVCWPGRLDYFRSKRKTLLDGAHNPEGALLLHRHLRRFHPQEIHLVFGALKDKDFRKMGKSLFPCASSIHIARLANARTAEPAEIALAHPKFRSRISLHRDARTALAAAWSACPARGLVVVTGSLYLIGELLPVVRACRPPLAHSRLRLQAAGSRKPRADI